MDAAAALFFAATFTVNSVMSLSGSSWICSSSLRFFRMLPVLLIIAGSRGGLVQLRIEIKKNKHYWLVWSTAGFVFSYAPLTFAAGNSSSLLASTWQITIAAGMTVAPLLQSTQLHVLKIFISIFF